MPFTDRNIVLSLKDLRKAYPDVVAVAGLDLEVRQGECFGLLGPNGAGKTTTVEICEGLTQPDSGQVEVLGTTWQASAAKLRQKLGVQLQETQLSEKLTVIETVRLFRSFYRQGPEPETLLVKVQLSQKRDAWLRTLSGGQKQRLSLACALAGDPEFLFLDEPTTGLDPQSRRHVWDLIRQFKEAGRTILLTTHYMDEAEELCDRLAIMDGGKVIATGTVRELTALLKAEHIVVFTEGTNGKRVDTVALERIEGVCGISREQAKFRIQVRHLHVALPAILDELAQQSVALDNLSTHSATLEDVFMEITGRSLRDE